MLWYIIKILFSILKMEIEGEKSNQAQKEQNPIPAMNRLDSQIYFNKQKQQINLPANQQINRINNPLFFYVFGKQDKFQQKTNPKSDKPTKQKQLIRDILKIIESQAYDTKRQFKIMIKGGKKLTYIYKFFVSDAYRKFQQFQINQDKKISNNIQQGSSSSHDINQAQKQDTVQPCPQFYIPASPIDQNQTTSNLSTQQKSMSHISEIDNQNRIQRPHIFKPFSHKTQLNQNQHLQNQENLMNEQPQAKIIQFKPQNYRFGLVNLGNTCYMNSSLQALIHTSQLLKYLINCNKLQSKVNTENKMGSKGLVTLSFAELIKSIPKNNYKCIKPSKFKRQIGMFSPQFNGFQQHDAFGFIINVLNALHQDLNQNYDIKYKYRKKFMKDESLDNASSQFWSGYCKRNKSIISQLFHGQQLIHTRCHNEACKHEQYSFEMFSSHMIPIPKTKKPQKLKLNLNVIKNHTSIEKQIIQYKLNDFIYFGDLCKQIQLSYFYGKNSTCVFYWVSQGRNVQLLTQQQKITKIKQKIKLLQKEKRRLFVRQLEPEQLKQNLTLIVLYHYSDQSQSYLLPYPMIYYIDTNQLISSIYKQFQKYFLVKLNLYEPYQIYQWIQLCIKQKNSWQKIANKENQRFPYISKGQKVILNWSGSIQQNQIFQIRDLNLQQNKHFYSQYQPKQHIKLEDCLQAYQTQLNIGNQLYCDKCQQQYSCDIIRSIYKAPKILIIHLKRFHMDLYGYKKDQRLVQFLPEIDLSKFVKNSSLPHESSEEKEGLNLYELYAIINHVGTLNGGHYYAYCKDLIGNDWYEYNDRSYNLIDPMKLCTAAAYILLYRKKV